MCCCWLCIATDNTCSLQLFLVLAALSTKMFACALLFLTPSVIVVLLCSLYFMSSIDVDFAYMIYLASFVFTQHMSLHCAHPSQDVVVIFVIFNHLIKPNCSLHTYYCTRPDCLTITLHSFCTSTSIHNHTITTTAILTIVLIL